MISFIREVEINVHNFPCQVKMSEVIMSEVKKSEVIMSEVKMSEVKISEVKMSEVKMSEVKMSEVIMSEVKMSEVKMPTLPNEIYQLLILYSVIIYLINMAIFSSLYTCIYSQAEADVHVYII